VFYSTGGSCAVYDRAGALKWHNSIKHQQSQKSPLPPRLHPPYILLVKDKSAHATVIRHAIRSANPNVVVKIEFRSQLHIRDKELQIKNIQRTTMHKVVKGLQHQVNILNYH
jgi:hypothetical protein